MYFKKADPSDDILHTVESYIFLRSDETESFTDTFYPNGKSAIIFHLHNHFLFSDENRQWIEMPAVSILSCQTTPVTLKTNGKIDSIIVLLHPYSLFSLFRFSIDKPIKFMDANTILPDSLVRQLTRYATMKKRINMLDNYFSSMLRSYDPLSDSLKEMCDFVVKKRGLVERKTIAGKLNVSENYVHKLFVKKTGLSFKPFARIVRISGILEEIDRRNRRDWIGLIVQYGFFDQTHFIKDFKKITGKTPLQYSKSDKILSLILTK